MSAILLLGFVIIIAPLQYPLAFAVGPFVEFLFMDWRRRSKDARSLPRGAVDHHYGSRSIVY
jgi:hypothetical protein